MNREHSQPSVLSPQPWKLRARLRTRLFVAYGAVLLVALAAIAIAVFTTVDNARVAAEAAQRSSATIRHSTRLWQLLSDFGAELYEEAVGGTPDAAELARLERAIRGELGEVRRLAGDDAGAAGRTTEVERDFDAMLDARRSSGASVVPTALARARAGSIELTRANLERLNESTFAAHERAAKVAILLGATTALILLIGVWVSVRLARSVTQPLEAMIEGAGRFASGEFTYRLPHAGVREIDALGERFNWMAEALDRLRATDVERVVRERARNETVLESIDDGLVILDAQGRIQRANPVALRQLGAERAPGDVVGIALRTLLPDAGLVAHIDHALASREKDVLAGELARDVAGSPRRLGYSLVPFHDGTDPGLVLVLRDVTEQRAFEALRTQFMLRASHELRTPLTGLRMAFDLVERKLAAPHGSRDAELTATIRHELSRLAHLVSDLVDLSRLQAESTELHREDTPVAALLEASLARHAARAAEAGVTIAVDDRCGGCTVSVDRTHIGRVFDNLVDNALRASPPRGTITLRAARHGGEARFDIEDQGAGVPLGLQARIFEPFTQFGGPGGGPGLGLALAREIVARHGGRIALESQPGQGARFTFVLPLA